MATRYSAFRIEAVIPLKDRDYYWFVLDLIRSATHRVWVSMFLIDVRRAFDSELDVRSLVLALRDAMWRGVDVRIMVGHSSTVVQLREMNMVSLTYMRRHRLAVRTRRGVRPGGTHDKYLVVDHSTIVLGSHNWIEECFGATAEDSMAVVSQDLNLRLSQEFLGTWTMKRRPKSATQTGGSTLRPETV
jgi:phosphatidylserine/phosphatidylglycerophosphate/cardiolipin synthase-like enzyme